MTWLFSKRCKKLIQNNEIKVNISFSVFNRLNKLIEDFNESYMISDETGFNSWTNNLEAASDKYYGEFGYKITDDFEMLKENDAFSNSFDLIELFYIEINSEQKNQYQSKFNEIMDENILPWRMADGRIFPVNSKYIAEEILQKTTYLLKDALFQGALHEFNKAREEFTNKEYENAITWANKAVESTIKSYCGIQKSLPPGKLYDKLKSIDCIPSYLHKYIDVVSTIRNADSAHGQGLEIRIVPANLAELSLNMAASIIKYLVQLYIDENIKPEENETIPSYNEEEIPF